VSRKRSTKTTPPKSDLVSLLAELDHPDSARRRAAVEALGHLDEPQATSALLRTLHDPDSCVRTWAASMLGGVGRVPGRQQAVKPLISILGDTNADVRSSAAISLGYLRDPRAIQPLITCLHDPNASVRGHAANALGSLGAREAIPLLLLTLQDVDRMVRIWSAVALCNLAKEGL
jgi:HEAT repeat protein